MRLSTETRSSSGFTDWKLSLTLASAATEDRRTPWATSLQPSQIIQHMAPAVSGPSHLLPPSGGRT